MVAWYINELLSNVSQDFSLMILATGTNTIISQEFINNHNQSISTLLTLKSANYFSWKAGNLFSFSSLVFISTAGVIENNCDCDGLKGGSDLNWLGCCWSRDSRRRVGCLQTINFIYLVDVIQGRLLTPTRNHAAC